MATGTGNLPYPGKSYTPFDILTAEELNEDVANIESLADGTGIGDGSITTSALVNASVTAPKIDFTTFGTVDANGWKDFGTFWYKRYNATNNTSISANANIYVDTTSAAGNTPVGQGSWSTVASRSFITVYSAPSPIVAQTGLVVTPDNTFPPGFFVFNGGSAAATFGTRPITIMIFKS